MNCGFQPAVAARIVLTAHRYTPHSGRQEIRKLLEDRHHNLTFTLLFDWILSPSLFLSRHNSSRLKPLIQGN